MRRIINNTTAIAACLSLLAPHMAAAQGQPTDAPAEAAQQGGDAPLPPKAQQQGGEAQPEDQLDEALKAQEAPAPDRQQPAQAPEDRPSAATGETPDADTRAEDARPEEARPDEGRPNDERPKKNARQKDDETRPAEAERQQQEQERPAPKADRQGDGASEQQGDRPARSERRQNQDASEPASEPQEQRPARNERRDRQPEDQADRQEQRPAPKNDDKDAKRPAGKDRPTEDELGRALETQAQDDENPRENARGDRRPEERREDRDAQGRQDRDAAAFNLAGGGVQQDRAQSLPGLASVLDEEISGGLRADQLTCLEGGDGPCDGPATTPRGVVVEPNGGGAFRLAAPEAQSLRVNRDGQLVQRAAEEDVRETEAAREAAQAQSPANAAALEAQEGSGNVTEERVTEADTRSSSEDFATNLRDALNARNGNDEAREDDDDDNDLTKALLLGLGAVAVGSYLNNNRQVALSSPDRVVVTRSDGSQEVIKDEVALLRQPGSTVSTENFDDGSSRTIVTREDGSKVVTIRDADLRVLRRTLVSADGQTTRLIDDTQNVQPVDVADLPDPAPVQYDNGTSLDEEALRDALRQEADIDRRFTLSQVRNIPEVRALVAPVNIDAITFETGSAAIRPDQAKQLSGLGNAIQDAIAENPSEIFLIEGHTDTVGSDPANLALSDRRAESVALALTEYFDVPPENLVTQGYGEQFLRVRSEGDIRDNRRAAVRRITDLIAE
ncbi:OmpA family protein [Paracoccus sp. 1_MG-2023]|uniref:OmpA family protein n=1 Tax=unclassified Paracoccus (in: a-proteobacteria) TaxID=2688777 RepID=UPI001C092687|nr:MULTISPECIES: OmpA family protein [unclassified Paracoccus (in: a-proteobacteria)]MBU2957485.1 OmpA family protein [Paracoccus sp. C2R09]MDO6670159.1 OmpA family protein [Paracoccus sp. 1_MG-2023]